MSFLLPHLHSGYAVDQAILHVRVLERMACTHDRPLTPNAALNPQEEARVVVIRFGHDGDDTCMQMDETLASVADKMKNFAVVYLVDITEVPDFNAMYELYDPCTVMFFFRNRVRRSSRGSLSLCLSVSLSLCLSPWKDCKVKLPSRRRRPESSSQHVVPSRRGQSLCDTNLPAYADGSFEPRDGQDHALELSSSRADLPAEPSARFVCPGRTPHPRQRSHASPSQSPFSTSWWTSARETTTKSTGP